MLKIKVCGITNVEDALWAANLGANYIGLNFYKGSPRKISNKMAKDILSKIPPFVKAIGVFVDEDMVVVKKVLKESALKTVQLHGSEDDSYIEELKKDGVEVFKAIRVRDEMSIEEVKHYSPFADFILLDAFKEGVPGGTGDVFNWDIALTVKELGVPFFLSGGLNPENIEEAIDKVAPYGVDVASGVERTPKKKDYEKMKDFIIKAKDLG
ncbi:MAG: phosphoribosylanthranilate isomerase [bacterium]